MVKRVTMKDIAARAGVAQQSVSEVVNNSPHSRIKQETRDRILTAARELGYRPNYMASSLKKGRTDAIGFIGAGGGDEATRFTLANMNTAAGIEDALPEEKSLIMLSGRGAAGMRKSIRLVQRGLVDGLILKIYPFHYTDMIENVIPQLDLTGIPYVVVHPTGHELQCPNVGVNRGQGAYLIARSLIEQGITDIGAFVAGPRQYGRFDAMQGVKRAFEEAGVPFPAHRVIGADGDTAWGSGRMRRLLDPVTDLPRALVLLTANAAVSAAEYFRTRNVRIPEDLIVAGTTMATDTMVMPEGMMYAGVPQTEQGAVAVEMLLAQIDGTLTERTRMLEPRLYIKEKTADGDNDSDSDNDEDGAV